MVSPMKPMKPLKPLKLLKPLKHKNVPPHDTMGH